MVTSKKVFFSQNIKKLIIIKLCTFIALAKASKKVLCLVTQRANVLPDPADLIVSQNYIDVRYFPMAKKFSVEFKKPFTLIVFSVDTARRIPIVLISKTFFCIHRIQPSTHFKLFNF